MSINSCALVCLLFRIIRCYIVIYIDALYCCYWFIFILFELGQVAVIYLYPLLSTTSPCSPSSPSRCVPLVLLTEDAFYAVTLSFKLA